MKNATKKNTKTTKTATQKAEIAAIENHVARTEFHDAADKKAKTKKGAALPAVNPKPTKAAARKAAETVKTAEPKKAAKDAKSEPSAKELKVRLYAKGEFYFGSEATKRLGETPFIILKIEGRKVTLTPSAKDVDGALAVMKCHAASVLRAKKHIADLKWNGETQNLIAQPVGSGFAVEVQ